MRLRRRARRAVAVGLCLLGFGGLPLMAGAQTGAPDGSGGAAPAAPVVGPSDLPPGAVEHSQFLPVKGGRLAASLITPATDSAVARPDVVLIVAGSGPTNRDGNTLGVPGRTDSLKRLAQGLAQQGIATLRYDKRGIGASRPALGAEADLRFDDLADDVAAWIPWLRAQGRFGRVVLLGHSEGGSLAQRAVERGARPDALILLEAPADRAADIIRAQLTGRLPAALAARSEAILAGLELGQTTENVPQALMPLYRPDAQPYLMSWLRFDPRAQLAASRLPVLIVQGTHDLQVPPAQAQALLAARPDARLLSIEGMNHVLKLTGPSAADQADSYRNPGLTVAPALIEGLARFVADLPARTATGAPASR